MFRPGAARVPWICRAGVWPGAVDFPRPTPARPARSAFWAPTIDRVNVIVMGVSGSGKTTIGAAVASTLGWPFVDGDALHPAANVAKMAAGHPLTDADRVPWLAAIRAQMDVWRAEGGSGVIACSALRRAYRDALRAGHDDIRVLFLDVDAAELRARLGHRQGHFMPASLLESQLATLEPPSADEHAITVAVDATSSPDQTAARAVEALRGSF
jgi:gluconokinase